MNNINSGRINEKILPDLHIYRPNHAVKPFKFIFLMSLNPHVFAYINTIL